MNIKISVLQRAVKEAKCSDVVRGKVGAVLFTNTGHILCSAHNTIWYGSTDKKWTVHAERFLLAKALKLRIFSRIGKRDRLNVLVVRYKPSQDTLANARPCEECMVYLKQANVKIYYSNEQGVIHDYT